MTNDDLVNPSPVNDFVQFHRQHFFITQNYCSITLQTVIDRTYYSMNFKNMAHDVATQIACVSTGDKQLQ